MNDLFRFGVFRLGQIFCVCGTDSRTLGFTSREEALSAALAMARLHRARGFQFEVVVQADNGQLSAIEPSAPLEPAGADALVETLSELAHPHVA